MNRNGKETHGFSVALNRRQVLEGAATVAAGAAFTTFFGSSVSASQSKSGLNVDLDEAQKKTLTSVREKVLNWVNRDQDKMVALFSALVRCKTPSPPGDTREALKLLQNYLAEQGFKYREVNFEETMPNMITSFDMAVPGRHVMLNGHLDVLPGGNEPGWEDDPWSGKIADGKVWGRGTADMKAGLVASAFAYTYLHQLRDELKGKLSLTFASDEETGFGRGTKFMFEKIESEMLADCVISGEPSGTEAICFCSKGYLQFTVKVATRGAIVGYSNESENSILIASKIMRDFDEIQQIEVELPSTLKKMVADPAWRIRHDELAGKGAAKMLPLISVDVGTIEGGDSAAVIAPHCKFSGAIVIPVGADPDTIFAKAKEIVARYPEAEIALDSVDAPDYADPYSEFAAIIQDTVEELGRIRPEMTPATAISDCSFWRSRGIPAYWYGPDGSAVSGPNEYVEIEELLHLVRTHTLAAAHFLIKS